MPLCGGGQIMSKVDAIILAGARAGARMSPEAPGHEQGDGSAGG